MWTKACLQAQVLATSPISDQDLRTEQIPGTRAEPFNDKLNDDVLKYQTKVHDSVLENATKRKEAPAKAQAALDVALNSWQMARQRNLEFAQSERERMDGKGREERKYVNCRLAYVCFKVDFCITHFGSVYLATIPDVMDTGAKYLNVLETLARIDAVSSTWTCARNDVCKSLLSLFAGR